MENKGQMQIAQVAIAALVFIIVMMVYGQVYGSLNTNVNGFLGSAGVAMMQLIPLILVASAIVGIVVVAFRMAQ